MWLQQDGPPGSQSGRQAGGTAGALRPTGRPVYQHQACGTWPPRAAPRDLSNLNFCTWCRPEIHRCASAVIACAPGDLGRRNLHGTHCTVPLEELLMKKLGTEGKPTNPLREVGLWQPLSPTVLTTVNCDPWPPPRASPCSCPHSHLLTASP